MKYAHSHLHRGATVLAIKPETIAKIERKFGREQSESFLREHNISGTLEALTEGEGKYLGSQPSLDALRAKIAEGRPRESVKDIGGAVQRPEALTPALNIHRYQGGLSLFQYLQEVSLPEKSWQDAEYDLTLIMILTQKKAMIGS